MVDESVPKTETVSPSEDEITRLKVEASEYKDKYLRALAEIENTRKGLQKKN